MADYCPKRGLRSSQLPGNCHQPLSGINGSANARRSAGREHELGRLLDCAKKPMPERGGYALMANQFPKDKNGVMIGEKGVVVVDAGINGAISHQI